MQHVNLNFKGIPDSSKLFHFTLVCRLIIKQIKIAKSERFVPHG